jgi:uncharacterized protein (DUF362 family)/Pyruvate/2-oxoacid:ferredoxin oxidoreductase delta subunit
MSDQILSLRKIHNDDVEQAIFQTLEDIHASHLLPREGMTILLKPNLLSAKPPERAVTTHPSIVKAMIHWLQQFSPKTIYVGDSSGGSALNSTAIALRKSGIQAVCDAEEGVICLPLEKSERKIYHVKNPLVFKEFASTSLLAEVDLIVDLPKIKTHELTMLTCAIKNMFGTVLLSNKAQMHARFTSVDDFTSALVDVYSVSKPHLIVVDGFLCQEGRGPAAGDVVKMDLIVAGYDGVAIDTLVSQLIGLDPQKVLYLAKAERQGLGSMDLTQFTFMGDPQASVSRQFKLPSSFSKGVRLPPKVSEFLGTQLFKARIGINPAKCVLCGKCWQNCPVNALTPPENKKIGETVPLWSADTCITCYCCVELCPEEAIIFKIKPVRNLLRSSVGKWMGIVGAGIILLWALIAIF